MVTRRRRTFRSRAPRRRLEWAYASAENLALGAGAVGTANLLADYETAFGADAHGSTVMRIRGIVTFAPQIPAVAETIQWGIVVVPTPYVTSLSPRTNHYEDWMIYESITLPPAALMQNFELPLLRTIDLRSRRRLPEIGTTLAFAVVPTGGTLQYSYGLRILLALP